MLKKILYIFIGILLLAVLVIGNSNSLLMLYNSHPYSPKSIFESDRKKYGDLYAMSLLPKCKAHTDLSKTTVDVIIHDIPRKNNLHILGDCNLAMPYVTADSIFSGIKDLKFYDFRQGDNIIQIDTTETNILLIERTERAMLYFVDTNYITNKLSINKKRYVEETRAKSFLYYIEIAPKIIGSNWHNNNINRNIESILFDFNPILKIREWKASFNYFAFGRTDPKIVMSPDEKYQLYAVTVDTNSVNSSFRAISDNNINSVVYALNDAYNYYLSQGFDYVFLSIIPNTATILYPNLGKLNNIVPRIQNHPDLEIPVINVYNKFKESDKKLYFNSDTHWNKDGFNIWLNQFNKELAKISV